MNYKSILLIFLTINPLFVSVNQIVAESTQQSAVINFDELEEEAVKNNVFDTIEIKPPHPAMIWLRIIGLPILNAYFKVNHAVRNSWHWMIAHLNTKNDKACNEKPASL